MCKTCNICQKEAFPFSIISDSELIETLLNFSEDLEELYNYSIDLNHDLLTGYDKVMEDVDPYTNIPNI